MIELIYNEEASSEWEEKVLFEPKNRKQIGEPREYKKIFIEDFVHTFLYQYSNTKGCGTSIGVLLGNVQRSGGKKHFYIQGAMPVEDVFEKQGKYLFTEKIWGEIHTECEKYFPNLEIMGWFLARPGFSVENNRIVEETHRTYFSGADKVLLMMEPLEGDCGMFAFDGNRFAKQPGYYIYYEKNAAMREFMMEKNSEQRRSASEKPDIVMANFRKILKEKQKKNEKRKKMAISYGTKIAVALVVFVGAVSLKNQTEKAVPVMENFSEKAEASTEAVIIEELQGDVTMQETFQEQQVLEEEIPLTEPEMEVMEEETVQESITYVEYIVQKGDTLAGICRNHYGTDERILEICRLNGIENGDYIQVGETILLP